MLRRYRVSAIELGAQSMSDTVLRVNDRGHTAADVRAAAQRIRAFGFELGLQMMTGLYGSTDALDLKTAEAFLSLRPDTVRIYPTIVMEGTPLAALYRSGAYRPQTLGEAVALCARLIPLFEAHGVRVIRVGLHDSESLRESRLAGPYHPAFRELCESRIMLETATALLRDKAPGAYTVRVSPQSRSKMTGNKKTNLIALRELGYDITIQEDDRLNKLDVIL